MIGNGQCNDEVNNEECNYDDGDCCSLNINKDYCSNCTCLEKNAKSVIKCVKDWIGDGVCDDMNNNQNCTFDGGDCCGPNINHEYCKECLCKEPSKNSSKFHMKNKRIDKKLVLFVTFWIPLSDCHFI